MNNEITNNDNSYVYEDPYVSLDENELRIFNFYWPSGKVKRIHMSQITSLDMQPLGVFGFDYKLYGMGFGTKWFPKDMKRSQKSLKILIDAKGCWFGAAITPNDPERCYRILQQNWNKWKNTHKEQIHNEELKSIKQD